MPYSPISVFSNIMNNPIELLAPGGDIDSIKAAILAGADAVYCGLDRFNARNRAVNISFEDLNGILRLAHINNCQVFLTLNIIVVDSELPALFSLLNKLVNTSIDGVIIQDLGLFYILSKYFKSLKIHASTQLTTHNQGQIKFLNKLNATRVNLSRELNINEIKELTEVAHQNDMLTEVFVHGSNCISFSGLCYMSSVHGGNSGNRGRCSQPCRDEYVTTKAGKNFPLNLKDNSVFADLRELAEAGVDSLKIEGRIKKFHYVYTVVDTWRKQLDGFYKTGVVNTDKTELYKVFNRDFSNTFLKGDISKDMFIDNPRDNSAIRLSELDGCSTTGSLEKAKGEIYDERTEIINKVEHDIKCMSISKIPLQISISGEFDMRLEVSVKTPDTSFVVFSNTNLADIGTETLSYEMVLKRFKILNDSEYFIEQLNLENLQPNLYLHFSDLTAIKREIWFSLNNSKELIDPVEVPVLKKHKSIEIKPSLCILISSPKDLHLCDETDATIYFQLPNCLKNEIDEYVEMFKRNDRLIPYFPSVLIGEDFHAAVELLLSLNPKTIVTDNTGIAFEAYKNRIPWVAGPMLNIVNSFSLLCLKEDFNCTGAFISNEISKVQLKGIKNPENFNLYFSIYHPIVLMTSRQCLFHQVSGCWKNKIDETCIPNCEKTSSLQNLKKETFLVEKSKGNYHHIYNGTNYLNTEILADFPDLFSGFMIDLRDINTETQAIQDKPTLIKQFENLLKGNDSLNNEIKLEIENTNSIQYKKGI